MSSMSRYGSTIGMGGEPYRALRDAQEVQQCLNRHKRNHIHTRMLHGSRRGTSRQHATAQAYNAG